MTESKKPEANNIAVASLVLGILSITAMGPLTGIPAIITGAIGLKNPVNKGMSIAGIVMGVISVLLGILAILFVVAIVLFGMFSASSFDDNQYYDNSDESTTDSSFYQQRA